MSQSLQPVRRPFGVTLLVVFGYIGGFFNIIGGIFVILDRNDTDLLNESFHSSNQLVFFGSALIVFGVIQMALAAALAKGSEAVRMLYAVIAVLNLAGGVWAAIALHGEQQASGIAAAVVSLLVLYLLFNHRAEDYFESRHHPQV